MKKTILFIILISATLTSNAQLWMDEQADLLFHDREYAFAVPLYEKLAASTKKNTTYLYKLALCHYHLKDHKKADSVFIQVLEKKDHPVEAMLYHAKSLHYLGKYEDAQSKYREFFSLGGHWPNLQVYIQACDYALQHREDNPDFVLNGKAYTLEGYYYGSSYFHNEILLSEPNPDHNDVRKISYPSYELAHIKFKDEQHTDAVVKFDNVETRFHLGSPCYTSDGKYVFFTQNDSEEKFGHKKKFEAMNISEKGINTLNIYHAEVSGDSLVNVVPMPFNSHNYSCIHPFITPDGLKLYFASDRPGGYGGFDLYESDFTNGEWQQPLNLGPHINSLDDEMYPYVIFDTIMFFSSDGHIGYGGSDVYKAVKRDYLWGNPENLGKPVNSSMDDMGPVFMSRRSGYFASNRNHIAGKDELFFFDVPVKFFSGNGQVLDQLTLKPLGAAKVLIFVCDTLVATVETDNNGRFSFDRFREDCHYKLRIEKPAYEPIEVEIPEDSLTQMEEYLVPHVEKDVVFTFNDILFEYDKADLMPESKKVLDRLADLLMSSHAKVEFSAHTDSRGSDKYNLTLSQKRSDSCVQYLIFRGVKPSQLIAKGYGETQLKNRCKNGVQCSDEEHSENRRVEIKVLEVTH